MCLFSWLVDSCFWQLEINLEFPNIRLIKFLGQYVLMELTHERYLDTGVFLLLSELSLIFSIRLTDSIWIFNVSYHTPMKVKTEIWKNVYILNQILSVWCYRVIRVLRHRCFKRTFPPKVRI